MLMQKNSLSKYSVYFSIAVVCIMILIAKQWNKKDKVIAWDVVSYYAYLPATFIFHDIKLENSETFEHGIFWTESLPDGSKVIKTSMGLSILYSPFFLISHGIAKIFGFEAYGYSSVYKIGLLVSSVFYFIIGLFVLRRILKEYFSEPIVALTIITVALGTNLLNYATYDACMSHLYNFTLINIFLWYTIQWYKSFHLKGLIILGALAGLIALVRPSNIIVLVFFFLYGVYSKEALLQRVKLIFRKLHWFIFMGIAFTIIWIPQFLYWRALTGHFMVNSYPDEQFFWGTPHFIEGLFSYRKGWLIYTPVMAFALVGIIFLFRKMKEFLLAILVFITLAAYVIVSWWCWWYGGSFGMRSFVDYYGILAIPLALLFSVLYEFKKKTKTIVFFIVLLAILQNNFFLEKYRKGSLHYDSMSRAAFWNSFWHLRPQDGYWELLEVPDYSKALEGIDAVVEEK